MYYMVSFTVDEGFFAILLCRLMAHAFVRVQLLLSLLRSMGFGPWLGRNLPQAAPLARSPFLYVQLMLLYILEHSTTNSHIEVCLHRRRSIRLDWCGHTIKVAGKTPVTDA